MNIINSFIYSSFLQATKFQEYNLVFPLAPLGYIPDPKFYMNAVGVIEMGCAALLLLGTRMMKRLACMILMFIMVGAMQTLLCNNEVHMLPFPACFFLMLAFVYRSLAANSEIDSGKKQK